MASKLIGIVGPTGSGKSTAIKFLDPKSTYVINVAKKELPFKGSEKIYNKDSKNYAELDDANEITRRLRTLSDSAPQIKVVIIEDSNYIMGFNMVNKATEVGYTKFSLMAQDMVNLFKEARKLREDMIVFYLTHLETIEDDGSVIGYKIKTAGKLIDNQVLLEGLLTVCLYTNVEEKKDGTAEYTFLTNRYKKFPAKSPNGMFDEIKIPNNLQIVVDKVNEYYK